MKRGKRRKRTGRRRPTSWLVGGLILGLGSLFLMAWQTHEIHLLQATATRLGAEKRFQEDEVRRLQVRWYQGTQREAVMRRATAELGLAHPDPEARLVVAIPTRGPQDTPGPAWLRSFASTLDRYGRVSGAVAGAEDQE